MKKISGVFFHQELQLNLELFHTSIRKKTKTKTQKKINYKLIGCWDALVLFDSSFLSQSGSLHTPLECCFHSGLWKTQKEIQHSTVTHSGLWHFWTISQTDLVTCTNISILPTCTTSSSEWRHIFFLMELLRQFGNYQNSPPPYRKRRHRLLMWKINCLGLPQKK